MTINSVLHAMLRPNLLDVNQMFKLINIIFFSLLDSDWLKTVPINP